jgi:alpha-tubulin suppressor-like RCC1 family protein
MLRSPYDWPRLAARWVLAATVAVQASCAGTTDASGPPLGAGFALTVGAGAVSLAPGGTASTSIKATRTGGLTSAITYAISSAPPGITASIMSTSVSDSSTITVTASATLAAATYVIVVNATAPGALPQQATVAVTVSVPAGAGPAISVVVTGAHTCALTRAGAAYCWGFNADGQLGHNDTSIINPIPVAVAGGLTFQSLFVSKVEGVSCGLTTGGAAYCWGDNADGQLGDGTTTRRLIPTPVAGGLTFRSFAVGNGHACGVAMSGTAYCWGSSPNGAFGDGSVGQHLTPAVAAPGMTFQSIVAGSDFTCALTPEGAAFCWGLGFLGQLGNGSSTSSTTPVAVSGGLVFRSLAAGGLAVCGLTTAGKAYCWGHNFYGTVGDGTSATDGGTSRRPAPVAVAGGLTFQSLSAGYQTMCGVSDTGAGYCWGYNFGAVGDGTFDHRSSPAAVAGGLTFLSISGGTGDSCGVTTANAVYCWGDNSNGELGDGTITARPTPAPVRWPQPLTLR